MSFILDALKKSEADRQRKNRPDSAPVATGTPEPSSSRWLHIVGALLVINVIVLLVVFLKPESSDAPPTVAVVPEPVEEPDSFRDLVANAKDRRTDAAAPEVEPPQESVQAGTTEPSVAVPITPAPSVSNYMHRSFNEVRADGTVQLPELHLDLHVYNGKPAERFVFINMSKYEEKATLSEGPMVIEIVPEGVILEYLGTRFLLPRE
jgi:general secretion pathway protein B